MLNIIHSTFNLFQEKTMAAWKEDGRCVVIDPGFYNESERKTFYDMLASKNLTPEAILLTHAHSDHVFGVKDVQDRYGIPVYMHKAERQVLDYNAEMSAKLGLTPPACDFTTTDVEDGMVLDLAGIRFEVIATPGHTPGGVCYLDREDRTLFSGDTLFAGTIGRTDFMYGEYDDEIRSVMEKLMILDTDTRVFPGHGPDTNIGHERTHNPFLEPFNEPEEEFDPDAEPIIISH